MSLAALARTDLPFKTGPPEREDVEEGVVGDQELILPENAIVAPDRAAHLEQRSEHEVGPLDAYGL